MSTDAVGTDAEGTNEYTFDDVSVVMGTYNEEAAIEAVLADIDRVTDGHAEVVGVDGSSDRTPEIARDHGARVVRQEPQGYGVAVREALLAADRPVVVTTDCDDTYPMEQLPEFLAAVNCGYDVVSGDRLYWGAEAMPEFNRFGNQAFALLARHPAEIFAQGAQVVAQQLDVVFETLVVARRVVVVAFRHGTLLSSVTRSSSRGTSTPHVGEVPGVTGWASRPRPGWRTAGA